MTKDFCDRCKKEITRSDGPVYVSFIHRLGDEMLCLACFSKQSIWKSLQKIAHKEIAEQIALYSKK